MNDEELSSNGCSNNSDTENGTDDEKEGQTSFADFAYDAVKTSLKQQKLNALLDTMMKLVEIMRVSHTKCYEKEGLAQKGKDAIFLWVMNKFRELTKLEVTNSERVINRVKTILQTGKSSKVTKMICSCLEIVAQHYPTDEDPQSTEGSITEDNADQLTSSDEEQEQQEHRIVEMISKAIKTLSTFKKKFIKQVMINLKEEMVAKKLGVDDFNNSQILVWMIEQCCKLNRDSAGLTWVEDTLKEGDVLRVIKTCLKDVTTYFDLPRVWPKTSLKLIKNFCESSELDYYKDLGIKRSSTVEEITKSYRTAYKKRHPDRHAKRISQAKPEDRESLVKEIADGAARLAKVKDVLTDPKIKAQYDRFLNFLSPVADFLSPVAEES